MIREVISIFTTKDLLLKNASITRCARERDTTAAAQTFSGDQEEDEGGEGDIRRVNLEINKIYLTFASASFVTDNAVLEGGISASVNNDVSHPSIQSTLERRSLTCGFLRTCQWIR